VQAAAVRAGGDFTLALSTTGKMYAWGDNALGQLGNGSTTSRKKPVLVHLPTGVKVTSISAGSLSALALTRSGRVLAWGGNGNGQLGTGSTRNRHTPGYIKLSRRTKVTGIAEGSLSSYAVTSKHTALAWGFNGNGRLGDGTARQRKSPVRVHLPAGVKVTAIAGGGGHALALTTGHKVLAWGYNGNGQLGDGQLGDGSDDSSLVPVKAETADLRTTAIGAGPNSETALAIGGRLPV
jgi:alpha-tubulin suppressor-like RCC1 family protein